MFKIQIQTLSNRRFSDLYYINIYHLIIKTIPDLELPADKTLLFSLFDSLPIYYLLIMAIHESAFLEYIT